ncbi:TPA: YecR family lipoprotein [Photobacterium damselae]
MDFISAGIKTISVMIAVALSLAGCATGGSKSDGTIRLSYQSTLYEKPILDESQALSLAKARCKSWGYSNVEAFGGVITQCQNMDAYLGCTEQLVTKEYQCID